MVKILNCYLYAKKIMALCLRVQLFLAIPVYWIEKKHKITVKKKSFMFLMMLAKKILIYFCKNCCKA